MLNKIKEYIFKFKYSILSFISSVIFMFIYIYKYKSVTKYESLLNSGIETTKYSFPLILLLFPIMAITFYFLSRKEFKNKFKLLNYFIIYSTLSFSLFYLLGKLSGPLLIVGFMISIVIIVTRIVLTIHNKDTFIEFLNGDEIDDIDDGITELELSKGDFSLGTIYKKNLDEDGKVPVGEDEYIESGKQAQLKLGDRFVHTIVLGVTGSGKTSQSLLPMVLQDFTSDNFKYKNIDVVQMGQIILEPKGDFAKAAWAIGKIKESEKRVNYINFLLGIPKKMNSKISELITVRKEYLSKENGTDLNEEQSKRFDFLEELISDEIKFKKYEQLEQVKLYSEYDDLYRIKNGTPLTIEESQSLELTEESIKKLAFIRQELPKYINLNEFSELKEISTYALFKYSALLTDIIANPDVSDISWEELVEQDKNQIRDLVMLFDPSAKKSPYFNPMYGPEETAVGTVTTTLLAFMADSGDYFQNMAKTLLQNAIHVAKRVNGNDTTLNHVNDLLTNNGGRGEDMVRKLTSLDVKSAQALENKDFANYFINDYYSGLKGTKPATRTYEQTSGVRSILNNLLDNKRLRKVLNPPPGVGTDIDFDKILKDGDKVALSTATGVSDELGKMLGSFLILQLQAAIFRRPGGEDTRVPVILYIDEFQDYASSSFEDVLTKGRSYVVSATMATQTLGIVGSKAGDGLVENLQSNARNVIVYPGSSAQDAKYFVSLFGSVDKTETKRSVSQEVENEKSRLDMIRDKLSMDDDSGGGGGPRESVSSETKAIDRFTETQVIYGPNVNNRNIGNNDAFGFVFYRIIINNSVQVPSVAKIQYIPRDIKDASDKLVAAYDSVNKLTNFEDDDDDISTEISEDPMKSEVIFTGTDIETLVSGTDKSSDPSELLRDKDGNNEISDVKTDIKIPDSDIPEIGDEIPDVSGPDLDEVPKDVPVDKPGFDFEFTDNTY